MSLSKRICRLNINYLLDAINVSFSSDGEYVKATDAISCINSLEDHVALLVNERDILRAGSYEASNIIIELKREVEHLNKLIFVNSSAQNAFEANSDLLLNIISSIRDQESSRQKEIDLLRNQLDVVELNLSITGEDFANLVTALIAEGRSKEEIRDMIRTNPSRE